MTIIAADHTTLSVMDGASPVVVAALRRHELTLSRGVTDATKAAGGGWRDAAIFDRPLSAELRASGVFVSGQAMARLRSAVLTGEAPDFTLAMPGEGTWRGAFHIVNLTLTGQSEGEMMFSLRLLSTGELTFTAAA